MTTLLVAGATGLVGRSVVRQALADPRVAKVVAPTRRPLPPHERLENPIVDFDHLPAEAPWWAVDAVICALGTTLHHAGSREAFRRVDLEYTVAVAKLARQHGAHAFALNSSLGANHKSKIFYSRTKGEVEEALAATGFSSFTAVRPSIIAGVRPHTRPAEAAAIRVMKILRPLLPHRSRVVSADRVAHALLEAAIAARPGKHTVESERLL